MKTSNQFLLEKQRRQENPVPQSSRSWGSGRWNDQGISDVVSHVRIHRSNVHDAREKRYNARGRAIHSEADPLSQVVAFHTNVQDANDLVKFHKAYPVLLRGADDAYMSKIIASRLSSHLTLNLNIEQCETLCQVLDFVHGALGVKVDTIEAYNLRNTGTVAKKHVAKLSKRCYIGQVSNEESSDTDDDAHSKNTQFLHATQQPIPVPETTGNSSSPAPSCTLAEGIAHILQARSMAPFRAPEAPASANPAEKKRGRPDPSVVVDLPMPDAPTGPVLPGPDVPQMLPLSSDSSTP